MLQFLLKKKNNFCPLSVLSPALDVNDIWVVAALSVLHKFRRVYFLALGILYHDSYAFVMQQFPFSKARH